MSVIKELDVRDLIPIERHRLLNQMFTDLPAGDSFIFTNDHDPKPLYYEFQSIHGDVVRWEYLHEGGREWTVKVTRTEDSVGRDFEGASTLIDLRKTTDKDRRYAVFHRYGMMPEGETMELVGAKDPKDIKEIFEKKFKGKFKWEYRKQSPLEVIVHITKTFAEKVTDDDKSIVKSFDVRPFQPAQRHEMIFEAFDQLKPGETFVFFNDHDPKPLYYQIEAENQIPFTWEYLEEGPEVWQVKVGKELV